MLSCFTLPEAVATRIAASNDNGAHEALAANPALPLEAAVLLGKTSRSLTTLQRIQHVQHVDVLHAVLSQRRETRKTILRNIINIWNMDEATQLQFVNRRLPADIADMYLQTRRWFPEPAAKAVLRASGPVAVEYLAELADTDLDDDTLANVAATVIENIEKLQQGHKLGHNQQILAARWLAEACWLRPVIKTAALNSYAATAIVALTQIGLTVDETATVVSKLDSIDFAAMAVHAATQLLTNPTVTSETRQLIAEQYPVAAAGAAADGAHRPGTSITDGRQLRNVAELDVLDIAVAGTGTFTHLADLIEHPATAQDPHILHRLVNLSKTLVDEAGPVMRKLMAHIAQLRADNELPETFDTTSAAQVWVRVQRQTADRNAAREATAQKGTHTRRETPWQGQSMRGDIPTADTLAQGPLGQVQRWHLYTLGEYWSRQLGDGISDKSATAWQTALDMADAAPEQSSADIVQLAKTLSNNK